MSVEPRELIRIAAIGDLHVREDDQGPYHEMFAEIGRVANVLALCGDLTDLGVPREAEILAQDLRACPIPVLAVLGNHDLESGFGEDVARILRTAGVRVLEGGHTVEIDDVSFAGVKGFCGGFGRHMLSAFGETVIKSFVQESVQEAMRLENALRTARGRATVVVMHYAPIAETIQGEPLEIYPFLGSARFAETIDRFEVAAVFHGHAHRGVYQGHTPGGVPVYNVARTVPKPTGKSYAVVEV